MHIVSAVTERLVLDVVSAVMTDGFRHGKFASIQWSAFVTNLGPIHVNYINFAVGHPD